jgi:hypothetical protein
MYYYNPFINQDPEVADMYNEDQFRQSDMTYYCPYCQYSIEEAQFEDMHRQPQHNPPPGPPQGPQYSPPPGPQHGPQPGLHQGPPSGPPPSHTPSQQQAHIHSVPETMAVDPSSIRPCLYKYVYIWPRRGRGYWAWLNHVGRRSASGYRWSGRRWMQFGVDLRSIESFMCY